MALTNGRLIRHRRALRKTTSRAYCSKRSVTQCVRVRIESGGGEGWGREPIEIALDCRVQITRRHLQIAAFKPHGNADTRPLTIPTREIKLIRTFKGSKIEYESKDNRFFLLSFSLCFFQRKRMEEKLRQFNDQLLNGVYQHFERKIEKERLKKIS